MNYLENKNKNILFQDWGYTLKTKEDNYFKIRYIYIFKDKQIKIISSYFLDSVNEKEFEIFGDIKNKKTINLEEKNNFVVTSSDKDYEGHYKKDLYINGDLNNYIFIGLKLNGEELDAKFSLNSFVCSQCIGWNYKESHKIKYNEIHNFYDDKLNYFNLDNKDYKENIKTYLKMINRYEKAKELEKTYTEKDYLKMSLASSLTEEENKTILKNNGFKLF